MCSKAGIKRVRTVQETRNLGGKEERGERQAQKTYMLKYSGC